MVVEEINETSPALQETPTETKVTPSKKERRLPKWERQLPKKLTIAATLPGPTSLYLQVEIESTETQRKQGVRALVDCGATGLFIDREYIKSNKIPTKTLSRPIPVFNVDGTANESGSMTEVVDLVLRYNTHSERALFSVTGLGKQNLILGHTWLYDHNPEVNWRTGKVKMSRCSPRCCTGCRDIARLERQTLKRETTSINAC